MYPTNHPSFGRIFWIWGFSNQSIAKIGEKMLKSVCKKCGKVEKPVANQKTERDFFDKLHICFKAIKYFCKIY